MLDRLISPSEPARPITPNAKNLAQIFLERVKRTPHGTAWTRKVDGRWLASSWRDFHSAAAAVASHFIHEGLQVGEKLTIVGSTRPEWCLCDIGGLLAGGVTVGAYPTLTSEQLAYILEHSDSRFAVVEDFEQLEKIIAHKAKLPKLERVLVWETRGIEAELEKLGWAEPFARALEHEIDEKAIDERVSAIDPKGTAIIVYTSGTTGPPKGAMISHENIVTMLGNAAITEFGEKDIGLSFLPMAHVAERVLAFYGRINYGTSTAYASSVPAVLEEIKEVQPTIFGSVPRIFEKAYARIQSEVEKAPPSKQKAFRWAEAVGHRVVERWQAGKPIPLTLRAQHKLADVLVFSKLRAVFGGRVRYFVTGAAPIPRKILQFFWAAGFPIFEVYGMTEATVVTHVNRPGAVKLGSVGKALPFVEDALAEDGEILIRGKTVFQGYYKEPEATAEAIDKDGWLHTGDIGKKDANGYLYIVDRKKHIIITAGGKNLTPANIENELKAQDPIISHVHAHGDRRPYVTAIVSLSPVEAIDWARGKGLLEDPAGAERMKKALMENPLSNPEGLEDLMAKVAAEPELRQRIAEAVHRGNQKLSRVEQVKRVYLLDREFSLERDEITPTLKVKRKNVEKKFETSLDKLYDDPSFGIVIMDK